MSDRVGSIPEEQPSWWQDHAACRPFLYGETQLFLAALLAGWLFSLNTLKEPPPLFVGSCFKIAGLAIYVVFRLPSVAGRAPQPSSSLHQQGVDRVLARRTKPPDRSGWRGKRPPAKTAAPSRMRERCLAS